ncbi:hypothetical protein T07_6512 [Trichinella nelsoni]|uniref:Uncharacterized protein n=1 Tax=Trichinella nelsoni TaxID=6336 RepID=A0A0V0RBN8_9BILA|nr:hypothetical protein T07_6512 [Trichinella nelsoni]
MRGKLLRVLYSMTIWRDLLAYSRIFEVLHSTAEELGLKLNPVICLPNLNSLDPGHSRQLSQHPPARLLLPLLPSRAMADLA